MKSRTYYCKALSDSYSIDNNAVIVIESTEQKKFSKCQIESILQGEESSLKYFIEKCRFGMPEIDVEFAKNEGF